MGDILDFLPAPRLHRGVPTFILASECSVAEIGDQELGSFVVSGADHFWQRGWVLCLGSQPFRHPERGQPWVPTWLREHRGGQEICDMFGVYFSSSLPQTLRLFSFYAVPCPPPLSLFPKTLLHLLCFLTSTRKKRPESAEISLFTWVLCAVLLGLLLDLPGSNLL